MPTPIHRDTANQLIAGLVTVAIVVLVAYVGVTAQTGGETPLKKYTYVDAAFADIGTLKPKEKVTVHGVRAGSISGVEFEEGAAVVHLRLDGDRSVYNDATARVGNSSALGKQFIDIDPGTPTTGEASEIPLAQTRPASDLDQVLSMFKPEVRKGLQVGLQEVGGGVADHGPDLNRLIESAPALLGDAQVVADALSDPGTELPALLQTSNALAGRFQNREAQIKELIHDSSTTLDAIAVDAAEPLRSTLEQAPKTLSTARAGLRAINEPLTDLASAADQLRPGAQALGSSATDLRAFLRESTKPLEKVPGVSKNAVPAVDALTRTVVDARPLVRSVQTTLARTAPFLQTLSPFAADAGRLFSYHDMLSGNYAPDKHFFSAMVAFPGLYNVSQRDPLAHVDPYPGPGGAWGGSGGIIP